MTAQLSVKATHCRSAKSTLVRKGVNSSGAEVVNAFYALSLSIARKGGGGVSHKRANESCRAGGVPLCVCVNPGNEQAVKMATAKTQ